MLEMDTITTVMSIILVIGICFGMYYSPNSQTLLMLVAGVSLLLYGYGRYWRNPQGFLSR
jgi:hypothetical protein